MNIGATNPALATIQAPSQSALSSPSGRLATSGSAPPVDSVPSGSVPVSPNSTVANIEQVSADSLVARSNDPLQPNQVQSAQSRPDAAGSDGPSSPLVSQSLQPQLSPQSTSQSSPQASAPQEALAAKSPQPDPQVQAQVRQLAEIDREVRDHEAAHAAAGGALAGAPSFSFTRGPDGQLYATGGEVNIDTSASIDPGDTAANARTVIQAALAPANPSTQDLRVAAQARAQLIDAQAELSRNAQQAIADERAVSESGSVDALRAESVAADVRSADAATQSVLSQALEADRIADEEAKASEDERDDKEQQDQGSSLQGSSFQDNRAALQEREARIRQSQLEFAQELAVLNQRIQQVQQQLIETGEVDPASLLQGSLLDTLV